MPLPLKILTTYMIVSMIAGMVVMVADACTDYRIRHAVMLVNILYLPPLALAMLGLVGIGLALIWGHG